MALNSSVAHLCRSHGTTVEGISFADKTSMATALLEVRSAIVGEVGVTKKEVEKLISVAIDKAIAELRPSGWRKLLNLLKEYGPPVTFLAAFVGLLGITFSSVYVAVTHVQQDAEFRTDVRNTLSQIQRDIAPLRLNRIANLEQSRFEEALPELRQVLSGPGQSLTPESVRKISTKLRRVDSASSEYWPTFVRFIETVSSVLAPQDIPVRGAAPNFTLQANRGLSLGHRTHLTLVLDGGELVNSRIENSRVIFTADPVRMKNVVFVNCVFEFRDTGSPNEYLIKASQQLLASGDLKAVEFSI
jgi:hypothetical protein